MKCRHSLNTEDFYKVGTIVLRTVFTTVTDYGSENTCYLQLTITLKSVHALRAYTLILFTLFNFQIFMAIISGVMQMAGTGDQVEDIGDARSALYSLFGIIESVKKLNSLPVPFNQSVNNRRLTV